MARHYVLNNGFNWVLDADRGGLNANGTKIQLWSWHGQDN